MGVRSKALYHTELNPSNMTIIPNLGYFHRLVLLCRLCCLPVQKIKRFDNATPTPLMLMP